MTTSYSIPFVCLILLVWIQNTNGLRCYGCTSCGQPFNSSNAQILTNNTMGIYCRKISAAFIDTRDISDSCTSTNIFGNGQWCCQTDLCNAALKPTSIISLVMLVLSAFIF